MRIVYMGTPEFAVASLERLYDDGHDIVAVFTQPDKPQNRGMKISYSPVKKIALEYGTITHQPSTLRGISEHELSSLYNCDVVVVVAYGKLLPLKLLDIPPFGCINIHASLLPKYRGAAPIHWAILNGETKTGVTAIQMVEKLDAGDILNIKSTSIGEDETSAQLHDRLSTLGADLISETLNNISSGNVVAAPQDHSKATYAPQLSKNDSPIDWTDTALNIKRKVRGLNSWPAASAVLGGIVHKVFSVDIISTKSKIGSNGEIISTGENGIEIVCSDGIVVIKELQAPGGKRMSAAEYLRGNNVPISK